MSIRVLIVDDHAVVRAGLRLLLDAQDDIETVGEAGDAREAIFEARSAKPDVVLMDVVLGGKSGIEVTPELLHEQPETRVLVLSMQEEDLFAERVLRAGAHGFVSKQEPLPMLLAAIEKVLEGWISLSPRMTDRILAARSGADVHLHQLPATRAP